MKKKRNYLYAALVFIALMGLMNGLGIFWSVAAMLEGALIGGEQGTEAVYLFLEEHMNFYSIMIYLPVLLLFSIWFYFAIIYREGVGTYWKENTKRLSGACFGWTILLTVAMQHATSLVFVFFQLVSPETLQEYNSMVEGAGITQFSFLWAVSTLLLPPLTEEIIFRGLIMRYLRRAGACFVLANLLQAVLFGIFHQNLIQGVYAALLGFLLGYLAWRYDSLLVPIFMHFLYNLFGTVVVDLENAFLPEWTTGILMILSVPLLAVTVIMIHFGIGERKKRREKNR